MSQEALINLSVVILFIPLLGFILTLFMGMKFKWAFLIENVLIVLGFILSVVLLYAKLSGYLDENIVSEFEWINFGVIPFFGEIVIKLGIKLDNITVIMNFTVFLISMLVHLFSIEYMKGDKRYNRYFAYLRNLHFLNVRNCFHPQCFDDVHFLGAGWIIFLSFNWFLV